MSRPRIVRKYIFNISPDVKYGEECFKVDVIKELFPYEIRFEEVDEQIFHDQRGNRWIRYHWHMRSAEKALWSTGIPGQEIEVH